MAEQTPRFSGVDFSASEVEKWTPANSEYTGCGQGFKCSRNEFVSHWKHRVPRDEGAGLGKCWIIRHNGHLAAYITLMADRLQVKGADGEPKSLLKHEDVLYKTFPAVKIGLLAADKRARGAGTRLVDWALDYIATTLSPQLGVRFVTVDAAYDHDPARRYDASPYYLKFGFEYAEAEEVPPEDQAYRTMFLDIRRLIERISEHTGSGASAQ